MIFINFLVTKTSNQWHDSARSNQTFSQDHVSSSWTPINRPRPESSHYFPQSETPLHRPVGVSPWPHRDEKSFVQTTGFSDRNTIFEDHQLNVPKPPLYPMIHHTPSYHNKDINIPRNPNPIENNPYNRIDEQRNHLQSSRVWSTSSTTNKELTVQDSNLIGNRGYGAGSYQRTPSTPHYTPDSAADSSNIYGILQPPLATFLTTTIRPTSDLFSSLQRPLDHRSSDTKPSWSTSRWSTTPQTLNTPSIGNYPFLSNATIQTFPKQPTYSSSYSGVSNSQNYSAWSHAHKRRIDIEDDKSLKNFWESNNPDNQKEKIITASRLVDERIEDSDKQSYKDSTTSTILQDNRQTSTLINENINQNIDQNIESEHSYYDIEEQKAKNDLLISEALKAMLRPYIHKDNVENESEITEKVHNHIMNLSTKNVKSQSKDIINIDDDIKDEDDVKSTEAEVELILTDEQEGFALARIRPTDTKLIKIINNPDNEFNLKNPQLTNTFINENNLPSKKRDHRDQSPLNSLEDPLTRFPIVEDESCAMRCDQNTKCLEKLQVKLLIINIINYLFKNR